MWLLWVGLQALSAPSPATIDFDLRTLKPPPARCGAAATADIVICARRAPDRAPPLPATTPLILPKAQIAVGGGTLSAEAKAHGLDRGAVSQRAMVTLRLPF